MWLNIELENYLNNFSCIEKISIFITDLENVIFSSIYKESVSLPISKHLLLLLLKVSSNRHQNNIIYRSTSNNIVVPFDDFDCFGDNTNQLILPIYNNFNLCGSIILFSSIETSFLSDKINMLRHFIEKSININSIAYLSSSTYDSNMFSEDYFDYINFVLKSKESFLNDNSDYVYIRTQLNTSIDTLKNSCAEDQNVQFNNVINLINKKEKYELVLVHLYGVKYGNNLNNF